MIANRAQEGLANNKGFYIGVWSEMRIKGHHNFSHCRNEAENVYIFLQKRLAQKSARGIERRGHLHRVRSKMQKNDEFFASLTQAEAWR